MRRSLVLVTLSLSALAACDLPLSSGGGPVIRAEASASTVSVTNAGGRPVHYMIHERVDVGLILWGRCSPANEGCPVLAPGETLRIPYAELGGYDPGDTEAIIYWWESEPDGNGGYRIVRRRERVVRL